MKDQVIGIDIGGTNIRVGLVDEELRLVRKETALTGACVTADELFAQVRAMIGKVDPDRLAGRIGIALPVPWKEGMESLVDATNIPCIENLTIAQVRAYLTGYEVHVENDVNVIALLEAERGAAADCDHAMYITVSTGIGSGVILNHAIHHGAHGYAGEIGGMIVSEGATLEALCSGKALEEESKRLYGSGATTQTLFEKHGGGDGEAAAVIDRWVEYFSGAIASLMQTIDPDVFIVGGAVIDHNRWLLDRVKTRTQDKVLDHLRASVRLVPPAFGPDAGVIGAGYAARIQFKGDDGQ